MKGLILAGGKSSRMGYDKSLMVYHGKPQREYLHELLSKFCDEVFFSCKSAEQAPENLNPLPDRYEIESPLNGIMSAFAKYPEETWLAVAVDMPFVNADTLNFLIKYRDPNKVATCFRDSDGENPEPLLTIWEAAAYPHLQKFYNDGKISPRAFLQANHVNLLVIPDKKMLVNINTKSEFDGLE